MLPLLSDQKFNSIALIVIAVVGLVPVLLSAYWSRSAKKSSAEAVINSAEARSSAEAAAQEVLTNGGMTDPNPNLNDHVKYQTAMLEALQGVPDRMSKIEADFAEHLKFSSFMGQGMAEMYLHVMGREVPKPEASKPEEDS